MKKWSIFGVNVTPKFTKENKNILKVNSKKEIFFDVFECKYNGEDIIVEQVGETDGLPIVRFETIKDRTKLVCEAILVEDEDCGFIVNEDNLEFIKNIEIPPVKTLIQEKIEKTLPVPVDTVYEDRVKDISKKIIAESEEKAQELYDNKLQQYKDKKQKIAKQAEKYLTEKSESIKRELYEQYIDFLSNNDENVRKLIESNIADITSTIHENINDVTLKIDRLSDSNKQDLIKILSENIVSINNNLDNKIKDLNDQLDIILHDNNTKINKLNEKNTKHTNEIAKNITSKIKQVDEKIEDYKIDTIKHVVEKIADNKTKIEASLKNTISEINEQVDIKSDEVKKILAAELSNINEKLNIFSEEEDKKYKQLLENLNNLNEGEVKEILSEKINDKQLNSLKQDISKQFQNEIVSIKRLIEMSAGGGTNAVQYANGGTMNGNLNITQNILSGGVNLDQIFSTESSSVCAQDLQGVTNLGNTTTNSISSSGTIFGNIGDFTTLNALTANFTQTIISTTSALSVVNDGTGPALYVQQSGAEPVAHFIDKDGDDIVISDNGNLGIGTFNPSEKLTVVGNISTVGNLFIDGLVDGRDIAADGLAIDNLESDVVYLSGEIDSIDVEIDNLFTEVDYLSGEIDSNTSSITNLETDVTYLSGEINDNTLSITNLETDVTYLSGEIDSNSTGITNLETDVTYLSGEIDINQSNVTYLSGEIDSNTSSITNLETDVDYLSGEIDSNSTGITNLETDVTYLSGEIDIKAPTADPTFTGSVSINGQLDATPSSLDGTGHTIRGAQGTTGGSGGDGGNISILGGTGGTATNENSGENGDGGDVTIDAGSYGTGGDNDGVNGHINIGTTNAGRISIGNSGTLYTIEGDSSFRSAIGAAGTADPDFTGNVSLSRIDGLNDILIEPSLRGFFSSDDGYNLTLTGGSTDALGATGNGGDVNIQGGSSNATGDDGDINIGTSNTNQVNIGSITDVESEINNIESNVTYLSGEIDEKAPLASPSFTGTITSSGLLDFGERTSNDVLIRGESDSNDITLIRAASNSDAVGVSLKYIGSGSGDENIFEITTDGGGSFKIDNSGDVGINTAPVDGIDLTVGSFRATGKIIGGAYNSASGNNSTVVGGKYNSASGNCSFVGSGGGGGGAGGNNASGNHSFVGGGSYNVASGTCSFVGGGRCNCATGNHSMVLGGYGYSGNIASGTGSAIIGNSGYGNRASGTNAVTLGGGAVQAIGYRSVVIGGYRSYARCSGSAIINSCFSNNRGTYSSIIGGSSNTINTGHNCSFIIGTNLTSNAACTTFVNNLSVQGSLSAGNGITSNGDLDVCGTTNVTKITLTLSSFMTETDSFTLGTSHKGATVLLQNTSPITITIPSLVAGHVTTFIAETTNDVTFTSGSGLSGLNSFNGASSMLGQFAQAQVIFKTSEYAFLGGQIT